MANFITTSIEWNGRETTDIFLKPLFIGDNPLLGGVRVIPNVQSKLKLNYFGAKSKVLKVYAKGFSAVSGTTFTQRDLEVQELKAEMAQDAYEFAQTVFEQVLGKGVDWNNLESADAELRDSIIQIFQNAVLTDIFRKFWLNDTAKETISGGFQTGTADADYNEFNGIWKLVFDNMATSPSASQIKRVDITSTTYLDTAPVAEVDTHTLTGTSGTANIAIDGINYLATFTTNLTTSAANFVTSHAAALAIRGITVTSSGADVILTAAVKGRPITSTAPANVSGDLAGTKANTTANVVMGAIKTDGAKLMLKALYENANKVLKQLPASEKRFYVTDSVYENYITTLEGLGTEKAHMMIVDGVERITYRGVPVIPMGWNVHIEADSIEQYSRPHRALYTAPDNLVLGIDATSEFQKAEFWYNKDEQENRYRIQLKMGAQYVHPEFTAVAC